MIDYRSRWQRRRRRKTNIRRAIIVGVIVLAAIVLLIVAFLGRHRVAWQYRPLSAGVPYFTTDGGTLFVAWSSGVVRTLQLTTGKEAGLVEYDLPFSFSAAPAVTSDLLVVGSEDFKLHALSVETGNVCWQYQTGGPVQAQPVVDREQVLVGSGDGYLYCLDLPTGILIWKTDCAGGIAGAVALAEQIVVVGTIKGRLLGIDRGTGRRLFMVGTEAAVMGPALAVDDHTVTVGCDDGSQYVLEVGEPEECRTIEVGGLLRLRPIIEGRRIYVAGSNGRIMAVDLESGEQLWKQKLNETLTSGLAADDRYLYVGTSTGDLFAIDQRNGKIRHRWELDEPVVGSLLSTNSLVVAGLADGQIVALPVPD